MQCMPSVIRPHLNRLSCGFMGDQVRQLAFSPCVFAGVLSPQASETWTEEDEVSSRGHTEDYTASAAQAQEAYRLGAGENVAASRG